MMIVLARSSSLDNWPEIKTKKQKETPHRYPLKMGGLGGGGGWGIYIHKNTIFLVDQLYISLQIIIHSLPTVK